MELVEVLTGFKYIGEQMLKYENPEKRIMCSDLKKVTDVFLALMQEIRMLRQLYVCCVRLLLFINHRGKTLWDGMIDMYEKYGYYREGIATMTLKGIDGAAQIQQIMDRARQSTPAKLGRLMYLQSAITRQTPVRI